MGFSINTNSGAMIALQNLSSTNSSMTQVQNRINTGLKVASTKDDSATYAIAQGLRADIGGLNAVKSSLDRAKSTLDVAISAAESVSEVLVMMREKATAAMDEGMDTASRKALQDDFNKLSEQLASYVNGAQFNGSNILKENAADIKALLNADDNTQLIQVSNLALNEAVTGTDATDWAGGALGHFLATTADADDKVTATSVSTWGVDGTGAAAAKASVDKVNWAIDQMASKLSTLGSASRQIDAQLSFTGKLSDAIETGIGNLVDADLAKESARLQALQTKQQLGLQALSIANQAPQSILSLFR